MVYGSDVSGLRYFSLRRCFLALCRVEAFEFALGSAGLSRYVSGRFCSIHLGFVVLCVLCLPNMYMDPMSTSAGRRTLPDLRWQVACNRASGMALITLSISKSCLLQIVQ